MPHQHVRYASELMAPLLLPSRISRAGATRAPDAPDDESRTVNESCRKLLIVDDRQLFAEGLAVLLEANARFRVSRCPLGEVSACRLARLAPDLLLLGVGADRSLLPNAIAELRRLISSAYIVLLAESQDAELIRYVLDDGVAALVLTATSGADLAFTLDLVLRGQTALPAGWQTVLETATRHPVAGLSARQREVLSMLADGQTYEQIAERLIISVNTVKFHVRSIYLRLGVENRMGAIKQLTSQSAVRQGLHHVL